MRWGVSRRTDSASFMLAAPTMTWPNNCISGPGNIPATRPSFSVTRPIRGQPSTRNAKISTILGAARDWITRSTQSVPPKPSGSVLGAICTAEHHSLNPLAGCRGDTGVWLNANDKEFQLRYCSGSHKSIYVIHSEEMPAMTFAETSRQLYPNANVRVPDFKVSVEPKPVSPTKKEPRRSEAPRNLRRRSSLPTGSP